MPRKELSLPINVSLLPNDSKARSHALLLLGKLLPHLKEMHKAVKEIIAEKERETFKGNTRENLQKMRAATESFKRIMTNYREGCFEIKNGAIVANMADMEAPAKLRAHEAICRSLAGTLFVIVGHAEMVPELPENLMISYKFSLERLSVFLAEAETPKEKAAFKSQPIL